MELTSLKGIGEKTAELFGKLGCSTVEELLEFFPRDYEVFFPPVTIGEIGYRTFATIRGVFTQSVFQRRIKKMTLTTAQFKDEVGGSIRVCYFNAPFMKDAIHPGELTILRGRISRKQIRSSRPVSGSFSRAARMLPPQLSAIARATERPIPLPPAKRSPSSANL